MYQILYSFLSIPIITFPVTGEEYQSTGCIIEKHDSTMQYLQEPTFKYDAISRLLVTIYCENSSYY